MIGHISTAIDPMDRDATLIQLCLVPEKVILMAFATKGVNVRMLEQEKRRRAGTSSHLCCIIVLQLPGGAIFDQAKVNNIKIHCPPIRNEAEVIQRSGDTSRT